MSKVTREIAEQEISDWLDKKKVFASARETYSDAIDNMVDAMVEGYLRYDAEEHKLIHTLVFPLGENSSAAIKELTYKGRINDRDTQKYMKGVDRTDGDERLTVIISALTDTAKGIINGLDSATDKKIARSIAVFFI